MPRHPSKIVPAEHNTPDLILRGRKHRIPFAATGIYHGTGLKPWMRLYAEWLAIQTKRPGRKERQMIVNRLVNEKVSPKAIKFLEQRPDFLEYHDKIAAGAVTAARAKLEAQAPWYVDQHQIGLEQAIAKGDYKSVPNFTGPIIERTWPRREGATESSTININFTVRQAAELEKPQQEMLPAEIVVEPDDQPPV